MSKVIAIIPARGGSKRLKDKNIFPIFNYPMIYWAINACNNSKFIDDVYVSTEDDKIKKYSIKYSSMIIDRPPELSEDHIPKQEVIRHAIKEIVLNEKKEPNIVISVQPNSPEICSSDLDKGIKMLNEKNLWEVFSVGRDLIQNAAFRIMTYNTVFNTILSAHCGVIITDYIDIHNIGDVNKIIEKYGNENIFINR